MKKKICFLTICVSPSTVFSSGWFFVWLGNEAGLDGMVCNRKLGVECSERWDAPSRVLGIVSTLPHLCSRRDGVSTR